MLIKEFFCTCVGKVFPIGHYESGECRRPPMALPFILGAIDKQLGDGVHRDNKMSASRLAHCLRKMAIEDNIPCRVDVRDLDSLTKGIALHEFCEKYTPDWMLAEYELPQEGKPKPLLFEGTESEIEIRGRIDVLDKFSAVLEDYKSTSEWSQKKRFERGAAELEWNIQASVYKILLQKCEGVMVSKAVIWSTAQVSRASKAPGWVEIPIVFMNEREILNARPLDGDFSVRDIIREYKKFVDALAQGTDPKVAVANVPLMGQTTRKFKECDYCTVKWDCTRIAGGVQW